MTFAAERIATEEKRAAFAALQPLFAKLATGERLSVEDQTSFDARNADISRLDGEIETAKRAALLAAASSTDVEVPEVRDGAKDLDTEFRSYLKTGARGPLLEARAAGEATNSAGGYLIPPGWWQRLQVAQKAFGGTSNDFEQVETASGQPMTWATVNPTAIVGTLLAENTQVSTQDYAFGQGSLGAYMYTSGVQLVSIQLANDSAFDIDKFVSARVGESLGRANAQVAISGTGSSQPLGINTALAATASTGTAGGAISQVGGYLTLATAGVVKNFAGSTTELASNTLNPTTIISMIASVDPAYRDMGAKFYLNDNQALGLRGQVDANGRPLLNLQDGLTEGAVGTLFGYPVKIDQNIPNLAASTTGGPIFGHLNSAMVRRTVTQSGLLRLTERYADYLQIGFIGFERFDIRSNDLRAAVTVKAAAS